MKKLLKKFKKKRYSRKIFPFLWNLILKQSSVKCYFTQYIFIYISNVNGLINKEKPSKKKKIVLFTFKKRKKKNSLLNKNQR